MANEKYMAWYNSLPKEKRDLLDKWEELGLCWTSGPVWSEKPHSVELEGYTDGGEDMIINLEDISNDELEKYADEFDIEYNVSLWWKDGKPGEGVPFDSQAEQVEDYEQWVARIKDIVAQFGDEPQEGLTNEQEVYVERFRKAYKELRQMNIGVHYDEENDKFDFYNKIEQ